MTDRQRRAEAEAWRSLRPGDTVTMVKPISETERTLIGQTFTINRFTQPHGFAVVTNEHGAWHVHPEGLEKVS